MMMVNEMRTAEMVVSGGGDGNYATNSSTNGQCLLHVRSRLHQQSQLLSPQQQMASHGSTSSSSSTSALMKKSLPVRGPGDDVVKRTRSMNVYEMSQDLLDKQIELLERKYGGRGRANNAARVIQRSFRHYSMRRKFATITAMAKADQRRLSRRLHNELVESTAWSTSGSGGGGGLVAPLDGIGGHSQAGHQQNHSSSSEDSVARAEYVIRTNFASLVRELNEEGVRSSTRSVSSAQRQLVQQMRMSPQHHHHQHFYHHHHNHHLNHLQQQQTGSSGGHHYAYQHQHSFDLSQYHHAHYQQTATSPPPPPTTLANGVAVGPIPSLSHSPYGSHHHVVHASQANHNGGGGGQGQPQQQQTPLGNNSHEFRRSDSKSSTGPGSSASSKRVPPEVPRRTSSALSTKSPSVNSSSSQGSLGSAAAVGLVESSHPRQQQQQRSQTPNLPGYSAAAAALMAVDPAGERRTSNLSAEHSTSEDSLEGAGYSNIFWSESGGTGHQNHPVTSSGHTHSSPVPFPNVLQYDRLTANGGPAAQLPSAAATATLAGHSSYTSSSGGGGGQPTTPAQAKVLESIRKRQYRVGLNLFNKKPERGVAYLTQKGFLEASPRAVAKFFISRKGVSKQMIGEYLGNLQNAFNMAALDFFIEELDFAGLDVDVALRRFQTYFRMPGEAQKIERLMEVFGQRYCQCNPQVVARLRNPDTVFILAFAVIMLNTDLHTPSIKADKRMKLEDFIKNLRGIDEGANVDQEILVGIYERVKAAEFKPGADHVTQVLKVQQSIVGKKPNLVLPHRRLVCYCRLYEVADAGRRERAGLHQREVFLFNDILVVTKIFSKKKNGVTYSFRQSFQLAGLNVSYFESHHYPFGIRLSQRVDGRTLIMFNARNDHDRAKFCEDLREAILEMDEMENLRIEGELDKQRTAARISRAPTTPTSIQPPPTPGMGNGNASSSSNLLASGRDNRDSGVADMDHNGSVTTLEETSSTPLSPRTSNSSVQQQRSVVIREAGGRTEATLKRTTLSNSLLDIHDPVERYQRRGSVGSLDSGMSISFQSSTTNSTMSRDSSPKNLQPHHHHHQQQQPAMAAAAGKVPRGLQHQSSFLGNIFHKARERKNSRGSSSDNNCSATATSTAVNVNVTVVAGTPGKQPAAAGAVAGSYPTPHCTDV